MEPLFRFALSQPITTVVIGCDNVEQLEENVKFAGSFSPMTEKEIQELIGKISPDARELMYYKTSPGIAEPGRVQERIE
jgi:predicted aldo/keto reductase-like oxidoreductase